jgi:hypothetical protein
MPWVVRLLVIALLLADASTAWAKFPPFTLEVEQEHPVVGRPVEVVIRTEQDVPVEEVGGLLAAWTTTEWQGEERRGPSLPITLRLIAPSTFAGRVVFPEPGAWVIVSFPNISDREVISRHYPDVIRISVGAVWYGFYRSVPGGLALL